MSKHRKIYEKYYGPIPKENNGRTYDIHHIDGDHNNNLPENLRAVSCQEHYDIHYGQGDYAAALKIASRLKLSPEEISAVATKNCRGQVEKGTHPFLGGEIQRKLQKKRVVNGIHNFRIRDDGSSISSDMVANGTHHWLNGDASRTRNLQQVANGTHPFLGPANNRKKNAKYLADGTHNFITNHPSKTKVLCIYCNKEHGLPNYNRWHGVKCKFNKKGIV